MIFEVELQRALSQAFLHQFKVEISPDHFGFQSTRKDFVGSHTFVVFPYLKQSKRKPEDTAQLLGEHLVENVEDLKAFNVVKGFLNLEFKDSFWLNSFETISKTDAFGFSKDSGRKVMVEYSSPNTNKPLHLGHLRNNFLGFSASQILKAMGHEVMMVNLVNDRGIHICKSMLAYQKFGSGETPESSGMKGDHLAGKFYVKFDQEYKKEIADLVAEGMDPKEAKNKAPLLDEAKQMLKLWEAEDPTVRALWEKMNGWVYKGFDDTYNQIGVSFDKIYHESNTYLSGKDIVAEGLSSGVFTQREDGSVWIDLEPDGLDQKLLLRSDGTSVYMTQDMGTSELKHKDFPFDESVYVVGNEQDYHFKVLFKIMEKLGRSYAEGMYHLSYGMVDLPTGKMKSREGTVVDADDLLQEMRDTARKQTEELGKIDNLSAEQAEKLYDTIGLGALKFFLLKVDPKKRMLFDPKESVDFQGNTAPFIQYAHARIKAILRKAASQGVTPQYTSVSALTDYERDVIVLLNEYPAKIALAARDLSPAVIANYAYDLAKTFNRFYVEVPILSEKDINVLKFRLLFSDIVASILSSAMGLLGIDVPDQM